MIADSSFLISLLTPEDDNNSAALRIAKDDPKRTFIVPDRVLEETVTAMTYKRGARFAIALMDELHENRQFKIRHTGEEEIKATFRRMRQTGRNISFVDYLIVELCSTMKLPTASFDRQLLRELKK